MTENQWVKSKSAIDVVDSLRPMVSRRKLQLFAVAAFSRLSPLLPDPSQQEAIQFLESDAENQTGGIRRRMLVDATRRAIPVQSNDSQHSEDDPHYVALMLYRELNGLSTGHHAAHAANGLAYPGEEHYKQLEFLRCIFGNPFRPVAFDPVWRTSTAVAIAQAAYDSRAFGNLPVLADALQDAGCENADVLDHLRGPGPHVRGCWVVDLVLGKS